MADDHEVGYGKPPKATRFKKGQSGNPKGRPKGSLNFQTLLGKIVAEMIEVTERGKTRRMTRIEAVLRQLLNKALSGDLRATTELLKWCSLYEESGLKEAEPIESENRRKKLLESFYKQLSRMDQNTTAGPENDEQQGEISNVIQ